MSAPWRTALCTASCLVTVLLLACGVVRVVHSFPCESQSNGVQLPMIVCFITASNEHYDYDSLRTGLCSHIVLIDLIGVGKDGSLELLQTSSRSLNRFCKLKQHFSDVGDEAKFIISIGGVAQKSSHFSKALKTSESRFALSDELISFTIKHKLGGLDIAWFYPAQFGGAESDRTNLIVFLRDLYLRTNACGITLSLTVGVDPKDIEISYDVPRINEVVDFVNLLTGDYHNPTSPTHISPLYGQGPRDRLNINYSVMSYIEAGLNPRKMVIMGSCYAYLYISKICKNDTVTTTKLRTVMRLSYLSATELITRESFRTSWDDMRHVPYGMLTKDITKKWLTYNDVESMRRKADYAQHHQLGGMGLFSVDEDDYGGRAGFGRYPMLRALVSILYPELDCSEEELEEEIETIVCPYTGYLTDPVEPECYYACEEGIGLHDCPKKCCPQGQTFSEVQNKCYQTPDMTPAPCSSGPTYPPMGRSVSYPSSDQYQQPIGYQQPTGYQQPAGYQQPTGYQQSTGYQQPTGCQQLPEVLSVAQNNYPIVQADPQITPYQPMAVDSVVPTLMGSPSTMAPMYASMDEPEHQASNLVAHVVVIPNGSEGHITPGTTPTTTTTEVVEEEVEILNTPCALKGELEQATDPPVVITPKPNRSSRREKDRKRKSRSKSHSGRATSTETSKETTPITTPALTVTVTESLPTVGMTTVTTTATTTTTTTTTTTAKPSRARKTTTDVTPGIETTEPRMVSSSASSTSSTAAAATTTSTTTTTTTPPPTTTVTVTTTPPSTTVTTADVTFADKTSPIVTSPPTAPAPATSSTLSSEQPTTTLSPVPPTLSNTRIATTKTTTAIPTTAPPPTASTAIANTTLHDAPLPLETTIT